MLAPVAALAVAMAAPARGADDHRWALEPFPPLGDAVSVGETLNFVSKTLGDHMVLQRAPQQAVVWGHTTAGAVVTTTFDGKTYTATADVNGTWRQTLPPTPASATAYTLSFTSDKGEAATLSDVLFGDVYICGGQSNMAFAIPATTNSSYETQFANNYPHIRIMTVGTGTGNARTPYRDLQTVSRPWEVASNTTISGGGGFGWMSSVCWFFGRRISDAISPNGEVPIGLVSNNWGGTRVEQWSTVESLGRCNRTAGNGNLYNSMIAPYLVGPMAVSGFTWYQGESNVGKQAEADEYACSFPSMITEWRTRFANAAAYFGFIQLSTWCGDVEGIPEMRDAQMAALKLPNVGYATNADHGAGCNIHPPPKQYCGARLGDSALALQYGKKMAWRSPTYSSAKVTATELSAGGGVAVSVTVRLSDVSAEGLITDVKPFNAPCTGLVAPAGGGDRACDNSTFPMDMADKQCMGLAQDASATTAAECEQNCCNKGKDCTVWQWAASAPASPLNSCWQGHSSSCAAGKSGWVGRGVPPPPLPSIGHCAWGAIEVGGKWANASVTAAAGGLVLAADAPSAADAAVTATAYGWGPIPVMNAYDKGTGLPVLPWNRAL